MIRSDLMVYLHQAFPRLSRFSQFRRGLEGIAAIGRFFFFFFCHRLRVISQVVWRRFYTGLRFCLK